MNLSDEDLLEVYTKALKFQLDIDFIMLISDELERRRLLETALKCVE
ncbi:sporulation histidine kinase inhibitor Sda [Bacillus sp. 31A1R]|uniref:Sporulation histidine kinase inhibitor Sda n=1 Tax=Robertmurraya mangrovi TaxID=3098077 RepID=A0ABU5IXQ0_9BACI|nr:sporulation histidine kinase inhibitor Sda [Bacillus sp. 31A1R]MDZ5471935.1 sporulation histidine kinase inhibitor Sda [Bacillus sp. 31A1R]